MQSLHVLSTLLFASFSLCQVEVNLCGNLMTQMETAYVSCIGSLPEQVISQLVTSLKSLSAGDSKLSLNIGDDTTSCILNHLSLISGDKFNLDAMGLRFQSADISEQARPLLLAAFEQFKSEIGNADPQITADNLAKVRQLHQNVDLICKGQDKKN